MARGIYQLDPALRILCRDCSVLFANFVLHVVGPRDCVTFEEKANEPLDEGK
jgi:hypothetical protein